MRKENCRVSRWRRRSVAAAIVALTLSGVAGCQSDQAPQARADTWDAALADAAIVDTRLVAPPLTPITQARPRLVTWKKITGGTEISAGTVTMERPMWSTVDGELHEFCRKFGGEGHTDPSELRKRIERLLGLREGDGEGRSIIVFEIDAQDVIRPCPDPAITTTSCPTTFDDKALRAKLAENPLIAQLLLTHILASYVREEGYPFTRRGYTYDWDRAARPDHFGLSEYLTLPNARIEVTSVFKSLGDYCAAP
jgi:hypothetical protein